jgi:soluble lytic murein transglycosylase
MSETARRGVERLEAEGAAPPKRPPAEIYKTGTSLRRRKYFDQALMAFQGLLSNAKAHWGLRRRARLQIGRTLLQMERHAESLATFEKLADDTARTPSWQKRALYWKSKALHRMGRLKAAARAYIASQPDPERLSNEAAIKVAELFFHGGGYREAARRFLKLAKDGVSSSRWYLAWLNYRLGNYRQARDAFLRLRRGSKYNRPRYAYWAARAHAQLGEFDAAQALYTRIATSTPNSYYAYQARARLEEMGRPLARSGPEPCQGQTCDPRGPSTDAVTPLGRLVQRHPNVPGLREAYELAAIGEIRQAKWRLRAIRDEQVAYYRAGRPGGWRFLFKPYVDNRKDEERAEWARRIDEGEALRRSRAQVEALRSASRDRQFRATLREAFVALGDWYYVRRMSYNEADKVVDPPEAVENNPNWRRRYGRAYRSLIEEKAAKYDLDPLLLWAFMTVESAYNPWALSRVGARGLMQVMPHTGALIADRMAWRNFGTALLFEPEVVIEMGAWYVHQLLAKFDGQLPFAIAGYNAGPHRVASWLDAKGHLPMDEFIEEIPYNEARAYTKKVLKHLMLYKRVYTGRTDWPVGQVIDPRYRDNINF